MNCEKYLALDDLDKAQYMASLIHACQSDNELFEKGMGLIEEGRVKGLFDRVKIGHQTNIQENGQETESTGTPNG